MMKLNAVVLFTLMVVPGQAVKDSPVTKVVELIQELKSKIEADGMAAQKSYDKFACWCEKTLARKAAAIDAAKDTIDKTQAEIIELKGKLGELGPTLKQLEKEIAANEAGRAEATQIRDKEKEDYEAEKTEAEQCIGAIESAIGVLSGAGTKKAMLVTLHEAQLLSVAASVRNVLRRVPPSDALSTNDLKLIKEWVANPNQFSGAQVGAESANPYGDYAPASTQIVGILKGMYDSFTANLETANAEEADKQKAYEELFATQLQEHATLTATLEMKTKEKADAEKQLADDKVLLEETKAQLAADEKFFDETKASCKAKAAEWAEAVRLRTEELHGIEKAIAILEGGMDTFEAAHSGANLLQLATRISSDHKKEDNARAKAYARLKAVSMKHHGGLRLAFLAAELQSGGHFDKVIAMIDKMIVDLREEEAEDIKAKDICENQENALASQEEDLEYNIKKKGEAKKRLEAKKSELEGKIDTIKDEISATNDALKEALENRNKDEEEFKKAMKDDTDAIALLAQAIESLTTFYTSNKIPLELAQEPEYTVDPDKAPDASFGGPAKSESKGIIAILSMLKEDLEKEIKTALAANAKDQAAYEEERGDLKKTLGAQEKTENTLNGEDADTASDIADTEGEISNHEEMKGNTLNERDALKPSCQWVKDHFETRRDARKTEIEGLQEAKSILAGAPASFLQRQK
jgi:hypothetical protein